MVRWILNAQGFDGVDYNLICVASTKDKASAFMVRESSAFRDLCEMHTWTVAHMVGRPHAH